MAFKELVKRELEVAFSKKSQPLWFRLLKYLVLGVAIFFFWRSRTFWFILLGFFVLSIILHFWYRHKTQGWTKSFGGWKYDKDEDE